MQVWGTILDPQNSHSKAKRSVSHTCIVQLHVCKACLMKVCASHMSTGQACAEQECVRILLASSKGWVGSIQSSLWKYFNPESMPMPILHTSVYVSMGNIFYPWKQNTCFSFWPPTHLMYKGSLFNSCQQNELDAGCSFFLFSMVLVKVDLRNS